MYVYFSVIVANQLLDMTNKTVEYLMRVNKLLWVASLCFTLLLRKRLLKLHDKNHISYAFIHTWVWVWVCVAMFENLKMKFSTKQKRTNLYMKWCHKIRFVPHSHNFHIRYCCWAKSGTNFANNVTVWILYLFLYMWTLLRMVQLQMPVQCSTTAGNSPSGHFYQLTNGFFSLSLNGFNFSAWHSCHFI